jgi:hypothetical protein
MSQVVRMAAVSFGECTASASPCTCVSRVLILTKSRLPEELNGVGCHGALTLRGLAGSGYKLMWSSSDDAVLVARPDYSGTDVYHTVAAPTLVLHGSSGTAQLSYEQCGCSEGSDVKQRHDMVAKTNK